MTSPLWDSPSHWRLRTLQTYLWTCFLFVQLDVPYPLVVDGVNLKAKVSMQDSSPFLDRMPSTEGRLMPSWKTGNESSVSVEQTLMPRCLLRQHIPLSNVPNVNVHMHAAHILIQCLHRKLEEMGKEDNPVTGFTLYNLQLSLWEVEISGLAVLRLATANLVPLRPKTDDHKVLYV